MSHESVQDASFDHGDSLVSLLPHWEHEIEDTLLIRAEPAAVFEAMGSVRSEEMALGRWLARLRQLRPQPKDPRPFLEEMADVGWVTLAVEEDRLVAAGLVGRFWRRDFGIRELRDRAAFESFDEPGWAKILFAWKLEAVAGGTRLRATTRVHATSDDAERRLAVYFRLIRFGAHLSVRSGLHAIGRRAEALELEARPGGRDDPGYRHPLRPLAEGLEGVALLGLLVPTWPLAKRFLDDLGAHEDETETVWPGDRLLDRVDDVHTRALDVAAPVSEVWPWLLQIGLGRGGFHSYELIENLAQFGVKNVERIRPDLQDLEEGEEVVLAPGVPGVWVAALEPERHLCFRTWRDAEDLALRDPPMIGTWSLYLVPSSDRSCRLLLRTCRNWRYEPSLGARLVGELLEDPLDLVMEQRLLRTVRRLAERGSS